MPTMAARALQALDRLALDPIAATLGAPNSSGFRTERSTAEASEPCGKGVARQQAPPWLLAGDSRACFDGLSQAWFVAHLPMENARLQHWLKAGCREQHRRSPTAAGGPQGGLGFPGMAPLALDGRARLLRGDDPPKTKRAQRAQGHLVRYGDDGLITGSSPALLAQEITPRVAQWLHTRGLERSQATTPRTPIENGGDCLGHQVRKYAGTLLIQPAPKHVHTVLGHLRHLVKANKQATAGHLRAQLTPVLRGWATSPRQVVSQVTCIQVDPAILQTWWSWAPRRPPTPSGRWSAQQDFPTRHGRRWTFGGTRVGHHGQPPDRTRCRAGDGPSQRHVKIKGTANPYDPPWAVDVEERRRVKRTHDLKGRRQLRDLWKPHEGLCPVCHPPSTRLTGWHNHHRVWRTYGGSETADHRGLLHPTCHRHVHSQALDGAQARSARSVCKACAACRETCTSRSSGAGWEQSRPATRRVG